MRNPHGSPGITWASGRSRGWNRAPLFLAVVHKPHEARSSFEGIFPPPPVRFHWWVGGYLLQLIRVTADLLFRKKGVSTVHSPPLHRFNFAPTHPTQSNPPHPTAPPPSRVYCLRGSPRGTSPLAGCFSWLPANSKRQVWRLVARRLECPAYEMLETLPFAGCLDGPLLVGGWAGGRGEWGLEGWA